MPGFGLVPATLAGRDDVLRELQELYSIVALDGRGARPAMIVGVRGVGKTAILKQFSAHLGTQFGWPTAHVEVGRDGSFLEELTQALVQVREQLSHAPRRREVRATGASVKAQFGIIEGELRFERDDTPPPARPAMLVRETLAAAAAAASERESGFLISIDEAQLADKDQMNALGKALQHGMGEDWPFVTVAAGLPSMRDDEKSTTYFERGQWHELGSIALADAILALQAPAAQAGRPMDNDAAMLLAEASGGYPYTIQLYGHHAWRRSHGEATITLTAATASLTDTRRELNDGLYAKRWTIASDSQRTYLQAIVAVIDDGITPTGATVAAKLGKSTPALSRVRQELIERGMLSVNHGALIFTVPGMADYIRTQAQAAGTAPRAALRNPTATRPPSRTQPPRSPER